MVKYRCKSPNDALRDQLHHGSAPSALTLPPGPWEYKCRGKSRKALLWQPLEAAVHRHQCSTCGILEWQDAQGSLSVYGQLWWRWGQEGALCSWVISLLFHVCAEQCNKSLQMKILSWLEGNNSRWVLWHWPFKSCKSVWSRNTVRFLVRVQLQLYNSSVFHTEEDFYSQIW